MKKVFEASINALVGLAAVLLIYQVVVQNRVQNRASHPRGVAAGDRLPNIGGIAWGDHQSTLVLAVRKGCHFCEDSMPFYQRLAALRDQHQTDTQLVAVFPDSEGEAHGVLKDARLDSIGLASGVPLSRINVTGTPTLILVDKRGVVSRTWMGRLQPDGEGEVIKALKSRGL
jgi:hypothetical protein